MRINITESGIGFGSLVKLISVGYFIGTLFLVPMFFVPLFLDPGFRGNGFRSAWLFIPPLLVAQSLFTAVIAAVGIKVYEKIRRLEITPRG